MGFVICALCGELREIDGPDGITIHLLAMHPESEAARIIMRELARMPLPEPVWP